MATTALTDKEQKSKYPSNDYLSLSPNQSEDEAEVETLSIEEAVNSIGTGRFQWYLLFAAGTCFMADSTEIMLLSFLSLVLKNEWGLESTQIAGITSTVFAGALLGTLILGRLGDTLGRKPILLCSAGVISIFGLVTALCHDYTSLLLVRFIVGFGVGGLTVPFDMLAEFLPTESRGKFLLLIEYYWTAGSMLVPVVAYFTIGIFNSWQMFVIVCSIPCFMSFFTGLYLPESPRWLLSKGRNKEALEVLRKAAVDNKKDPDVLFPAGCVLKAEEEVHESNFSDLLKPKWRKLTLTLWTIWLNSGFCYYFSIMIITRIFHSDDNVDDGDDGDFDYGAIFITSSAELVATALIISLIDRVGRIPTQIGAYTVGGLSLFFLCFFANSLDRSMLICIAFIARISEMAGSCVTWTSTAEVLTTEIRSTGHSSSNAMGKIGAFISPFLAASTLSIKNIGIIVVTIHVLVTISVSRLPETKGVEMGKSAEEPVPPKYQRATVELT